MDRSENNPKYFLPGNISTDVIIKSRIIDPGNKNILSFYFIFKYSKRAFDELFTHAKLVSESG